MFSNYLKLAYRHIVKHKENSFIHILGLTIGLTGALLICLFVLDELKYDQFHKDGKRIFRIYSERGGEDGKAFWAGSSPAIGPTLKKDFPEIEQTLRLFQIRTKQLFTVGAKSNLEEKGFFAENSIFDLMNFPLQDGDAQTALQELNSIVLTAPMAQKYFGDENPIGKSIKINNSDRIITGVLAPLPQHTHLDFNFLVSFENLLSNVSKERMQSWVWQDFMNYIKLHPQADFEAFKQKLPAFIEKYAHAETKKVGFYYYLNLQQLKDIYLHSAHIRNDFAKKGSYQYLMGLGMVGVFLLIIACINFINLTTARAIYRAKEVGVRKAAGARRWQLALQFISEAVFMVAIATLIAAQLSKVLLPFLNNFTEKQLTFNWFEEPQILIGLFILILVTGLLAGAYPAFILSSFKPLNALKSQQIQGKGNNQLFRKGLVTLQFTLSILLIISVLILFQQVNFLADKELGFNKEKLLHFPMKKSLFNNFETSRAAFQEVPGVTSVSTCFGIPGDIVSGDNIILPEKGRKELPARIFAIDYDYIETMGMEIIAGRDFSEEFGNDANENFIINETALKKLGIADSPAAAIGKPLEWNEWSKEKKVKKGKIIGVVKDFHYTSLHEAVQASILHIYPDAYWKMAIRINTENVSQTIAGIEQVWDQFNTGYPIDYQFVDEGFGKMYKAEEKLSQLLWIFTLLAIFISCIGAFGLAAYTAERRRKEIGIRKVLGASTNGIITLLTKDFLKLVVLALFFAAPLAWYLMSSWLENFAYRIEIQVWVFLIAGLLTLLIAFLTVGFNSLRAALANPVQSLKAE